jgi:TonB family protein
VIDAVDRLIAEREAMDRGFPAGVMFSATAHVFLLGAAIALPFLLPPKPLIMPGSVVWVALPRGGGGDPNAQAPAPAATPMPSAEPAAKPEPAPKILKPPKDEKRKGLPELDAKKTRGHKDKEPVAARTTGAPGGTSTSTGVPGLPSLPVGPGTADGVDSGGDWYLAGVQRKIWVVWMGLVKPQTAVPAVVMFTILADGSVAELRVVQTSGVTLVDLAAQRAIQSAAPFAPLPREYGTPRFTLQAVFKPTQ